LQAKAEDYAAKSKWAAMTPDQKAAVRKSALQKRLYAMNTMASRGDDSGGSTRRLRR
jgi:hypothetical protein